MNGINRNRLVSIVLIVLAIWVYLTWDKTEGFSCHNEPRKWGDQWYYSNLKQPILPSIANYDISQYKFPESSLQLLKKQYEQKINAESKQVKLPVPHNIHSDQTPQFGGNENIHQIGAPLNNAMIAELNGMNEIMPQSAINATINQKQIYGAGSEMEEIKYGVQEIKSTHEQEIVLQELPKQETEKVIQEALMPGMEQKKEIAQEINKPFIIKVKKVNYNMAIALLLIVVLIGFIYNTKDY